MAVKIENQKPQMPVDPLSLLRREAHVVDGSGAGALSTPAEFDNARFAAAWYKEGSEVLQAQGRQFLTGTNYSAEGWAVWKFPNEIEVPSEKEGEKPKKEKHPMAGQPHKVPLTGGIYMLMFRPAEVQHAVNVAYGRVSRDRIKRELQGESVAGSARANGMLTDRELTRVMGAESSESGEPVETVLHGSLTADGHLGSGEQTLRR